ncbi:MAG: hypothetical protein NVS9B14_06130 [Candidatus Acidiferrum sp.]
MLPQRESLPSVTAAGVVAILFAALTIVFSLLMQIVLVALPNLANRPDQTPMPPGTRAIGGVFWFFVLLVGIGELFVAVNILRRKNWARISILIWAGIMAFFSAVSCVAVFFVLNVMPQHMPNVQDPAPFLAFMKFFLLVFYGIPFAIAVWWLILFTRPRVAAAFTMSQSQVANQVSLDASGFPTATPPAIPVTPKKPSCPVPLLIVAGLLIASAVSTPLVFLLPSTPAVPMYFFGFTTSAAAGRIVVGSLAIVYGLLAIGLIRLKPLALDAILALQAIFFLNGIASLASPNFLHIMHDAMAQIAAANPNIPPGFPFFSDGFFRGMLIFGLFFSFCTLGLLVAFRTRFRTAALEASR